MPISSSHRPAKVNLDLFNAIAHRGRTYQRSQRIIVWASKSSKDVEAALAFERVIGNATHCHDVTKVLDTIGWSCIIIFTFGTRELMSDNV